MTGDTHSKIIKTPIIRPGIDHASRVSVCIDLYCRNVTGKDAKVGSGTGFFRRYGADLYLITNWHVLTGRDPAEPGKLLQGYLSSPSSIEIHLSRENNPNHFAPLVSVPLYENGKASWIEAEPLPSGGRIDLAAIKFLWSGDPTDRPLITSIEDFAPGTQDFLRVGKDVVIIGYPFGIRPDNPYPVWKRGYVASEPSIAIGGLPKFYVDTPGRPGMSGSPIFMIGSGMGLPREIAKQLNDLTSSESALGLLASIDTEQLLNAPEVNIMKFAGVYSGSVGDQSLDTLRVGVAWHAATVDRIFNNPLEGSNPYMPFI